MKKKEYNFDIVFNMADGTVLSANEFEGYVVDCSKPTNQKVVENMLQVLTPAYNTKRNNQIKINENNRRKQKVLQELAAIV